MSVYTYKTILSKAKTCQTSTKKEYKLGIDSRWSYYFAKAIITPKKDITKKSFDKAPSSTGTYISRQISKTDYLKLAKYLVKFVEKNRRLPNYISYGSYKLRVAIYTEMFARLLVYYDKNGRLASQVNVNSKIFTKPVETKNTVYNYFVKVFGSFDNTIDGALKKVEGKGYSYYYDDKYSNKDGIDRLHKGLGINCTDSCQIFYNIMLQLIELGKYKKVECLHVQCESGGHVKLRITKNDGSTFIRDIACVISDNGKGLSCVWCTNTPMAVNPKWFMSNLKR